jgi:ADP-ribosylglycohydrolase
MRILPVAFVCHAKPMSAEQRYELVSDISSLTHAHEISVLGCYIYTNFVCHLLDGDSPTEAYEKLRRDDYSMFSVEALGAYSRILTDIITTFSEEEISGSGYVVNTLEAALWCLLTTNSYSDAVLAAVNLGEDTDTTGAVTGSLAGIVYGYDNIPENWRQQLRRHDYLVSLCSKYEQAIDQL